MQNYDKLKELIEKELVSDDIVVDSIVMEEENKYLAERTPPREVTQRRINNYFPTK